MTIDQLFVFMSFVALYFYIGFFIMFQPNSEFSRECDNNEDNIGFQFQRAADDLQSSSVITTNSLSPIFRVVLILIIRAGFLLVHIGSIPVTNVNLILLQNILDFCWVSLVYIFLGSIIAYTEDFGNILEAEIYWIDHEKTDKEEILFGWQMIIICSSICTTCIAGRTHTIGSLIIGVILSGILQPLIIQWTLSTNGWMTRNKLKGKDVLFFDSGKSIVHVIGGLSGMIGCVILGRRIMKVSEIDDASIPTGSIGTTFVGYFFIIVGLQSLWMSPASENHSENLDRQIYQVMINTIVGLSTCTFVVIAIQFSTREPFNHWTVTRCIQAMVAGVVFLSGGADIYSPTVALILGTIGGILFYLLTRIIFRSVLEDYCNTITTHFFIGLLSCLLAPLFQLNDGIYDINNALINLCWQFICLISIILLIISIMTPLFLILDYFELLRNKPEVLNHLRFQSSSSSQPPRSFMQRFFFPNDETALMQPGTVPIQENVSSSRSMEHESSMAKLEMPDQATIDSKLSNNP